MMRTSPLSHHNAYGLAGASATLLAVAIVLAGCGSAHTAAATGHGSARSASPAPTLAWRTISPPPGMTLAHAEVSGGVVISVSPVDGDDAWVCAPTATAGSFSIWASTDTGTSWRQVGTLVSAAPQTRWCSLEPDQLDTRTLAIGLGWGCGECGTLDGMSYLSEDGGANWHRVPGDVATGTPATRAGLTYALVHNAAENGGGDPLGIAISTDGLRTWRESGPAGLAAHDGLFQFWLNPTSSEILAASLDNTLWRSPDGGATWARINTPATQVMLGAWIAAAPAHWLLCGGAPGDTSDLLCSTDLGATWTPRPLYTDTYACSNCGKWGAPSGGTDPCVTNALTPTGALLASCPPNGTAPDPTHPDGPANLALYRLAPGATTWTNLGAAPGPWLTVSASGPVWCWNAQSGILAVTFAPIQ